MKYTSVTVASKLDSPYAHDLRTAVFSSRDAAETFKNKLEALFEKYNKNDCYCVTIDAGEIDSTAYLEVFEMDLSDDLTDEDVTAIMTAQLISDVIREMELCPANKIIVVHNKNNGMIDIMCAIKNGFFPLRRNVAEYVTIDLEKAARELDRLGVRYQW